MKKASYKLVSLCLTLAMLCGSFALATSSTESVGDPVYGSDIPITRSNQVIYEETFDKDGSRSFNDIFDVPLAEPFYRVWVKNTSNVTIHVKVTYSSYEGMLATSFDVPAGGQVFRNCNSTSGGRRYITISSDYGYAYSGTVKVRTASTLDELG